MRVIIVATARIITSNIAANIIMARTGLFISSMGLPSIRFQGAAIPLTFMGIKIMCKSVPMYVEFRLKVTDFPFSTPSLIN